MQKNVTEAKISPRDSNAQRSHHFCLRSFFSSLLLMLAIPLWTAVPKHPPPAGGGGSVLINTLNKRVSESRDRGEFYFNENGHLLFKGGQSPQWAINDWLQNNGLEPNESLGGIEPFKMYTHEDFKLTPIDVYIHRQGILQDIWPASCKERCGSAIIRELAQKAGKDVFKKMVEHQQRVARRRELVNYWLNELPNIVKVLLTPANALLGVSIVLLAGVPLILWQFAKYFFTWVFTPRPTILTDKDTNIYGNILYRMLWKFPNIPKIITNPELYKTLCEVVSKNKEVTNLNKGGFMRDPIKTPYFTLCLYGPSGTGKTLFAKNLAKESGMNFIYLTLSSLSQLPEEEALQTLSAYFRYAEKFAPCILIVDEADRLFNKQDIKAQKLSLMFQQWFSKAVHESIQLIFITNYPHEFPPAILSRISKFIQFGLPNFVTQKELFREHLRRCFELSKKHKENLKVLDSYLSKLDDKLCEGLVGRDIESICLDLSLDTDSSPGSLPDKIKAYRTQRQMLAEFVPQKSLTKEEKKRKATTDKDKKFFNNPKK